MKQEAAQQRRKPRRESSESNPRSTSNLGHIDDLWRYDGRRVVVTGCASGIGENVARQLIELCAEVVGLDRRRPVQQLKEFHEVDLADPASIGQAASAIGGHVDS